MRAFLRRLFAHRHRHDQHVNLNTTSIKTGAPVTVAEARRCRCGHTLFFYTPAGLQQIGWGASTEPWKEALMEKLDGCG